MLRRARDLDALGRIRPPAYAPRETSFMPISTARLNALATVSLSRSDTPQASKVLRQLRVHATS